MTPDAVKHLGFVARRDGMTLGDFVHHWTVVHAPMVARLPGLLRYSVDLVDRERFPGFDYDGIAEPWSASWADLDAAFASPEASILVADGPNFVGRRITVRCEEHPVVWPWDVGRLVRQSRAARQHPAYAVACRA